MTLESIKRDFRARWGLILLYARALGKWMLLATAAGVSCGLVGTAFHLAVEIATELLSMTGVTVDTAQNGREAMERFAAAPEEGYYDIIFMDIQMPVMDGYEAARKIRSLDRGDAKTVWIVAMMANAFVEDMRISP